MQVVTISELVRDIKIILDENTENISVLEDDTDQLQLEDIIKSRIVDAVRSIHEAAPSDMLDDGLNITSSPVTLQDGSGYVPLPDDFMRMIIFKLETWSRPVIVPIADTDPLYFAQNSKFRGIKGGPDKPVCAITTGTSGRVLEFFSVAPGTNAIIQKAKYLPLPKIEDDTIKVCRKLLQPIRYQCAGLAALTVKDQNAASFFEVAKSYIE